MNGAATQPPGRAVMLAPARLRAVVDQILRAAGADGEAAAIVAASLVESDLCGVSSHGTMRVPEYLAAIASGRIAPAARPAVTADDGAIVVLDGRRAFGQLASGQLVAAAVERARVHGIALGLLAGVQHVGRLGEWVEVAAEAGCIAVLWCNCGDPYGNVVPFGGRRARLGTNPIAYALPAGSQPAVVADFSTSIVAEGTVRTFRHAGRPVPDGWLIDAAGEASTDPEALYAGGAILPAAGHKGFALALLVEILGGLLAGAGCASLGEAPGNGLTLLAIDPNRTPSGALFGSRVAAVLASVGAAGPAVRIPGEPEREERARRRVTGIPMSATVWRTLVGAAATVGVDLPEPTIEGETSVV
jgi:LDH2 family malate/lactate/ureidoglycolate dehydrogenase